jgi:hypothetical protein
VYNRPLYRGFGLLTLPGSTIFYPVLHRQAVGIAAAAPHRSQPIDA